MNKKIPEKYYSLREAVSLLGISLRTGRQWIREGKMAAIKYDDRPQGMWYVSEAEIVRLQSNGDNR